MSGLVNHNGRVSEKEVEAIKASDLMKLMEVVKAATGLYNAMERDEVGSGWSEWIELGDALRALGLNEVTP